LKQTITQKGARKTMADMNKLLGQLLGSGATGGFAGGLAGGLTSSMLTSKSGRKIGTKALKMGGIAAVGALAYAAYQRYSTGKGTAVPCPNMLKRSSFQPQRARALCRLKTIRRHRKHWG
jgi:uncharacterized membrane protein YebE (DUF533 family)